MGSTSLGMLLAPGLANMASGGSAEPDMDFTTTLNQPVQISEQGVQTFSGNYLKIRWSMNPALYDFDTVIRKFPAGLQIGANIDWRYEPFIAGTTVLHPSFEIGAAIDPIYIVTGTVLGTEKAPVLGTGVGFFVGILTGAEVYAQYSVLVDDRYGVGIGFYPN